MEQTEDYTMLSLSPLNEPLPVEFTYDEEKDSRSDRTDDTSVTTARPARTLVPYEHRGDAALDRYFEEIRQYALLKPHEERDLWQRIEQAKARARRALATSPTALPTLLRLWNQMKHGEIGLHDILHYTEEEGQEESASLAHLEETIVRLQDLATRLAATGAPPQPSLRTARERFQWRKTRAYHGRQWIEAWARLPLQPHVQEMLRLDMETALAARPHNRALRAAQTAWRRAQRQLDEAKKRMMRANLRLVIHFATPFSNRGVPLSDLIQEGNLGLMRAIEKFEPERGHKFATYAYWWIRQALNRALIEQGRTVRLPSHVAERHYKLRAAIDRLWRLSGQSPSNQELSQALDWTPQEVERLKATSQPILSFQQLSPEGDQELGDLFEDANVPQPDALAEHAQLKHRLEHCLGQLKPREALILRRRYGLATGRPESLQAIGDALGLSRERIRQIEKAALQHLRISQTALSLAEFAKVV